MNYEKIKEEVKQILSKKRYIHTIGVVKRIEELAKIYNEDIQKAKLVAISHDIAKEMSKEQIDEYIQKNNIKIDKIEEKEKGLLHAKIGADICVKKYAFTKEMEESILYHTTGNIKMNNLAKILYLADKTEENRTYAELQEAIQISNENLDEGILYITGKTINKSIKDKKLIHPDTIDLINEIIIKKWNSINKM
ncbi:MAG: HD domain-containing protein [Clostridia bacterium]|jgi:predicted HD superfamily hydrolase involved in NAD metabolism|nr:HD domain-containing protein [Clostridia bacterium]